MKNHSIFVVALTLLTSVGCACQQGYYTGGGYGTMYTGACAPAGVCTQAGPCDIATQCEPCSQAIGPCEQVAACGPVSCGPFGGMRGGLFGGFNSLNDKMIPAHNVGMSACGFGCGCGAVGFSGGPCAVSACEPACEPACAPVCEPACAPVCEPACSSGCLGNHSIGNGGVMNPAPFVGKRQEAPANLYVTRGPRDFFDPNPNKIRY